MNLKPAKYASVDKVPREKNDDKKGREAAILVKVPGQKSWQIRGVVTIEADTAHSVKASDGQYYARPEFFARLGGSATAFPTYVKKLSFDPYYIEIAKQQQQVLDSQLRMREQQEEERRKWLQGWGPKRASLIVSRISTFADPDILVDALAKLPDQVLKEVCDVLGIDPR